MASFIAINTISQKSRGIDVSLTALWAHGFGTTQLYFTFMVSIFRRLSQRNGFFVAVFYSNSFQLFISVQYLLFNGLLSSMLAADEWNKFLVKRKTLRVSYPKGIQRSSYFLSLPFKYSIPLAASSTALHWLLSQSVFIIQTVQYQTPNSRRVPELDSAIVGYSLMPMILSLTLVSLMVIVIVLMGCLKKYDGQPYPMPLASTCSAAISAACHAHPDDKDAHLLPLTWGFVANFKGSTSGQFSFTTAKDVELPEDIELYLGLDQEGRSGSSHSRDDGQNGG